MSSLPSGSRPGRRPVDPAGLAAFREAIVKWQRAEGISQLEAASRLGFSLRAYQHIISGLRTLPSPEVWQELTKECGIERETMLRSIGYL